MKNKSHIEYYQKNATLLLSLTKESVATTIRCNSEHSMSLAKKQIRSNIKALLKTLPQETLKQQSSKVLHSLRCLPEYVSSQKVGIFMSMPTLEIQTMPIIQDCFANGKRVFLPRCNSHMRDERRKNHLSMIEVTSDEVKQLKPVGKYKLMEPEAGDDIVDLGVALDILIVPGVAFTEEKKRLGHGAGFYDEFLTYYTEKIGVAPFSVGVGLRQQLVPTLPTEDHDWVLDCVLIEDDVFR